MAWTGAGGAAFKPIQLEGVKPVPLCHARGEADNSYRHLSACCLLSRVAVLCTGLVLFSPLPGSWMCVSQEVGIGLRSVHTHIHTHKMGLGLHWPLTCPLLRGCLSHSCSRVPSPRNGCPEAPTVPRASSQSAPSLACRSHPRAGVSAGRIPPRPPRGLRWRVLKTLISAAVYPPMQH